VGPQDLDLVEVHDAVSPAELMHYRELGLCAHGDVGKFVAEKASAIRSALRLSARGEGCKAGKRALTIEQIKKLQST
jgi:acetyl-CoA acetyltransferase